MTANGHEQRRKDDVRIDALTARMDSLDKRIEENTAITQHNSTVIEAIKTNTDEIVEFFQAGKGFFTVVRAVGSVARWVAIIAAAFGIAYGIVKFGIGQLLADLGVTKK